MQVHTSVQFSSIALLCVTLYNPVNWVVLHTRLSCPSPAPELAQTHVYRAGDAIKPPHPLSAPSAPAFNLSQHQDLYK